MKEIGAFLLVALLGLILFLLNGPLGRWADNLLFDQEVRLSKAYAYLEQGDQEAHEKGLAEYILAGGGSRSGRALALYNLGNSALSKARRGDPAAAKDAVFYFKEALRNDSLLFPAKHNLEILVRVNEEKRAAEGRDTVKDQDGRKEVNSEERTDEGLTFPPPFLGSTP
ncbi:MAG: hypothetical protein PHS17_05940 [Desulfobacterales bacterium]|nr:hypothetical protein [Desulfobacterales bacterium]